MFPSQTRDYYQECNSRRLGFVAFFSLLSRSNPVDDGGGDTGGDRRTVLLHVLRDDEADVSPGGSQDEVCDLLDAHVIDAVLVDLMDDVSHLQLPAPCRTPLRTRNQSRELAAGDATSGSREWTTMGPTPDVLRNCNPSPTRGPTLGPLLIIAMRTGKLYFCEAD
eukprot:195158-Hanusia_phi.AAC.2